MDDPNRTDVTGKGPPLPHDPEVIEREAEKSREKLDAVPEPGTDPLHEGP